MDITKCAPNMASSPNTAVTFDTLRREVRDNIYEYMLTKAKTIITTRRADYGQPEAFGTLRATLHACPNAPKFTRDAYEAFFRINNFGINAKYNLGLLSRPVYYVKGQGFKPMMVFVQEIEIELIIGRPEGICRLGGSFRKLLTCPVLRRITVKVEIPGDIHDDSTDGREDTVLRKHGLDYLEIVSTATARFYHQELKVNIGAGLKFVAKYLRFGEYIKAWEEGIGKATAK